MERRAEMTREEAIESFKKSVELCKACLKVEKMRMDIGEIKELEFYIERDEMAIQALSQESCEKQIKIGTKIRTIKDKDFACEKVFPVGTIGIVERIDKGDNLPYKIVANNDYFYYSRDMFEIIEDVEPCDNVTGRDIKEISEIMKCDADAETKCKMISNILTAKPHYFEKQEMSEDGK